MLLNTTLKSCKNDHGTDFLAKCEIGYFFHEPDFGLCLHSTLLSAGRRSTANHGGCRERGKGDTPDEDEGEQEDGELSKSQVSVGSPCDKVEALSVVDVLL